MLVLSRELGEQIAIGPNIVVTVLEVRGNVVKLGCQAPPDVPIHREEISRRIDEQHDRPQTFFAECA